MMTHRPEIPHRLFEHCDDSRLRSTSQSVELGCAWRKSLLCRRVSRIDERLLRIIRRPRLARRSVEVQEAQLDRLSGGRDQQPRGVGRTTH